MKRYRIFSAVLMIVCLLGLCSCNTLPSQTRKFVGSFHSTYSDSQTDDMDICFTLEIKSDRTFTLMKNEHEYSGTWRSSTKDDSTQLICVMERGYQWNSYHPNTWTPYFVLTFMDDGTLMAVPATTSSSTTVSSAFGNGAITLITLVYFERD